jgi:hypothetical protein
MCTNALAASQNALAASLMCLHAGFRSELSNPASKCVRNAKNVCQQPSNEILQIRRVSRRLHAHHFEKYPVFVEPGLVLVDNIKGHNRC